MWKRSSIVKWFFLTMENPETFPPGGRPQHQNHPIPSNWYDTLDRNANISLNSKGLRNAPGENNCFLNSAVQVRLYFNHLLSFHRIIMYWGQRNGERTKQRLHEDHKNYRRRLNGIGNNIYKAKNDQSIELWMHVNT